MNVRVLDDREVWERAYDTRRDAQHDEWLDREADFTDPEPITVADDDYLTCARCSACIPLGWSHSCPDRVDPRRIALRAS